MAMTHHAAARCQQRGVPRLVLDLLPEFGAEHAESSGARKFFFDKPARRRLNAYTGGHSREFSTSTWTSTPSTPSTPSTQTAARS